MTRCIIADASKISGADFARSPRAAQIEKNVPLPSNAKSGVRRWPFAEMEIGDSLFSEDVSLQSAAHSWAQLNRKKFITRKVDGGVRVWRAA